MRRTDPAPSNPATDERCRAVLAELNEAGTPLALDDLAERLVRREATVIDADAYDRRYDRTRLALHHNVLPRLAAAGAVAYDAERHVVAARPAERAAIDWLDGASIDRAVAAVGTGEPPAATSLGVLQGRQPIIEYGRTLADEAETELFCLFDSPALLETECVRRAQRAIERGVTMSVGSRDPAVRDLTREHLPEATIWEPQRGWFPSTSAYPTVGRLVIADRESVMLAVLEEPTADGRAPEETALIGRGADSPLLVLVRDLLGSRLDHLDFQSATFRSQLPS